MFVTSGNFIASGPRVPSLHALPSHGECIVNIQLERLIPPPLFKKEQPYYYRYDCREPRRNGDVESLWNTLAEGTINAKHEDIINKINKRARTKNIVIIIRHIQLRQPEKLAVILEQFWLPLALGIKNAMAKEAGKYQHKKFFLFLIDYTGEMEKTPYKDADIEDAILPDDIHENIGVPLRLPSITRFSSDHLRDWINQALESIDTLLPENLLDHGLEPTIQDILNNSKNGDPYLVMQYICTLLEYSFEEGVRLCLTTS